MAPPEGWTIKDAEAAVQDLKEALKLVDITLPSVDRTYGGLPMPLVDLGRARPDVVQELAGCLTELVELRAMVKKPMEGPEAEEVSANG
ncbi:hypothetical protein [Streptomyces sp. NPDC058252]|uniref:hypothetical protein n=1 Tax=Streptomyces sp. NPDC058252 TaxID=3346405 RepID=UPI0036EE451F